MDTPGSTTPPDASSSSSSQAKRRRQVAFYPNMNSTNKPQKPFSRSAAKRESVMALGSIEYLQHYFTKTGIAAESDPLKKQNRGLVPAIGGLASLSKRPRPLADNEFVLPPSPIMPQPPQAAFPPYVKTFETDPENLHPGVLEDLISVAAGWRLDAQHPREEPDPNLLSAGDKAKSSNAVDVLDLLKTTTVLVRGVRNYVLSLPDDSSVPQNRAQYRPQTLSSSPLPKRPVSQPNSPHDPLTRIRGRALEVLAVLRELEERARLPLDHDAYDAQSDHGSSSNDTVAGPPTSRGTSPSSHLEEPDFLDADTSVMISFVNVGGDGYQHRQVPVWDDETSYDLNNLSEEEREKRDRWDERLIVGGGWLYRQDMRMEELEREREVVGKYLDAVDDVLFGGTKDGKRGWEREKRKHGRETRSKARRVSAGDAVGSHDAPPTRGGRRVVSTGMLDAMRSMVVTEEPEEMASIDEEESVDDEDLPPWAKRSAFVNDDYGRLHAILVAMLPSDLLRLLPISSSDHADTLVALSSGQLLCAAYNRAVRKSKKPWGYVSKDAIHDIAALEEAKGGEDGGEAGKRGWTFRRTDNLRLWAAALKLRYSIPIIMPNAKRKEGSTRPGTPAMESSPLPSPGGGAFSFPTVVGEDAIVFDAPLVARMEEGWDIMLERLVFKWVDAVVSDRRGER